MEFIYNGQLKNAAHLELSPDSPILNYGFGIFETMLFVRGVLESFAEHYARLQEGVQKLNMTLAYSEAELLEQCLHLLARQRQNLDNYADEDYKLAIKLSVLKENKSANILIQSRKYSYEFADFQRGFKLAIVPEARYSKDKLLGIKTTNYLSNIWNLENSRNAGFDEVLFLNEKSAITECATSNIFFIRSSPGKTRILARADLNSIQVLTPDLASGILPGIMRRSIIKRLKTSNIAVQEKQLDIADMKNYMGAFICNSLLGVMPVNCVAEQAFSRDLVIDIFRYSALQLPIYSNIKL